MAALLWTVSPDDGGRRGVRQRRHRQGTRDADRNGTRSSELGQVGGAFVYGICVAAVADLFTDARWRNLAAGVVGTAAPLGAVVGLPVVTRIEAVEGWRWALVGLAVLAACLFVGSWALPARDGVDADVHHRGWGASYRRLLANSAGVRIQGANVALSAAWFGAIVYLGSYAREVFGFGPFALALLYLAGGAGEVAGNLLAPLLLRRVPASTAGVGLAGALAAALVLMGSVAPDGRALVALVALAGLAGAGLYTVVSILLLDAEPSARGAAMAVFSAGFEAGGAAGTAGAGAALVLLGGFGPAYGLLALAPLAVLALLAWAPRAMPTLAPLAAD